MAKYKTNKPKTDPTYSPQWSGVTYGPKCRGVCRDCNGPLHHEADTHYCPTCDEFKPRPSNCQRRTK